MNKIIPLPLFGASIDASGTALSHVAGTPGIDLASCANTYKFSAQICMTGTGTMTLEYLCSNDDVNYIAPDNNEIVTGFLAAHGPTAPIEFEPPMCKYLKLLATETGGANAIVPTVTLAIQ